MSEIMEAKYREVMPERLGVIAAEIKSLQMSMCMQAIEIGRRLEEAKAICPRGKWGEWVKDMTGYSQSMAENYIKVFNGYGGGQINLGGDFVNSQSFANLGVTKLLELLAVPPEEREEFVKENDVENKSVSELRELLETEKKKNDDTQERLNKLQLEADGLRSMMEMYQEQIAQLEEQIENTSEEMPGDALDEFRKEAEAAVRAETEKSIQALREASQKNEEKIKKLEEEKKKLKDKLKNEGDRVRAEEAQKVAAAEDKANKASEAAEAALAEVDRLNKKLSMSSPEICEFKTLFETAQDNLDKLMSALGRIENKETADKLRGAVGELVKRYL